MDAETADGRLRGHQLDVFKTLGDNTRYAIYLELARSSSPQTTAEIADRLTLHPNTVRPHLERMRDVGLVTVSVGGRGDVGRPQHRYSIAAGAPALGLEPPTMPVLASMVLAMATRLNASADDAEAVGREEGAARAEGFRDVPSTLEALVADLDGLGFDPVVSDAPTRDAPAAANGAAGDSERDRDGAAVIAFAHCPFADLAADHPDLVCGLHRGLVAGFVDATGDAEASDFCTLTSRTPCRVTVSPR